ncbi:MAG TPA: MATE family efflux transporter, partial [Prevotella sp.]|nr:MATE family efflux transporter [Prevotella sp.]
RILMCAATAYIYLFAKKYHTYSKSLHAASLSMAEYKHINKLSWPVALQMGMESSAFALTGIMAGWLGT